MKIKRLDIIGFKSFVDKVSLDFQQGVTAVVGPNGCGKSNIVDAIRWVMGEQSAKNLRGKQMEDIIFAGSEFRKSLGMAEVSLVFSTEDGRIPAKYLNYSEIQVTRRLYRDGESEYYLNKTPCRLMDIAELFMDTGVGVKAYSIIEQGKIGMILLSKPEERRFLIEEAAGVTKFKSRKQVALRKIELTRQNLLRLGDIVTEIRRQLNSLQRQAKKAEKFRAYREELKEIELHFVASEYLAVDAVRVQGEEALVGLNQEVETLAAGLAQAELALEERRIAFLEEEKSLNAGQEEVYRVKGEMQTDENRLEFQRKEMANIERLIVRFTEELGSLERQRTDAENELKNLMESRELFAVELAGEEVNLCAREQDLAEIVSAESESATGLERMRRDLFALLSEISQFRNRHAAAARQLEALAERAERNQREELMLRERLVESGMRAGELDATRRGVAEGRDLLTESLNALRLTEEELKGQLAGIEKEVQAQRDEVSRKGSRLHSLQELEAQFEGYGRGVRSLFLAEDFKGRFQGVVADLVETGEEYETALEVALGDRLQYVVGDSIKDALAGVAHLTETSGGRCSFVVGAPAVSADVVFPEGTVRLLDRVVIRDEYREFVEPLLAETCIASDLESALAHARRFPRLTYVTPYGEVIQGGAIISGGSLEGVQQGLIHKKREIKELSGAVEQLEVQVRQLEEERGRLKGEIAAVEERSRETRQEIHQAEIQLVNLEKDLQRSREECQRLEERLAVKGMEDEQVREERDILEQEIADSASNRQLAEERKISLEREVETLQEILAMKKRDIDLAREVVTTVKVRVAALKEKKEGNLRAITRGEDLVTDLQKRISGHRTELEKSTLERERLVVVVEQGEEGLKKLVQSALATETAVSAVRERYETGAAVVREQEARLKNQRTNVEALRQTVGERNLRLSEATMKLRHLESTLLDKYRIDTVALLSKFEPLDADEPAMRERQAELQRLVDDMGEVNLTAIEEYQDLEGRYTFLTEQQRDLEESLQSLQKAIQRINRTTRKRFLETFHLVNAKFQEVFPRLFCGGRAELRLTNEEDLLETGIDIIVQPPGKKLQNVTLLSGGEKALTAVALIFAIFLIKPSPFCLLDEVDAPLDEANIGRFNDMIREMSSFSQFIMITHNRATMTVADVLYGITMEEPGVSKLVSVKLN
jgi:chromosome segregation protein